MCNRKRERRPDKFQRARILEIIDQLTRMSHKGWDNARPEDYQPLERELAMLQSNAR